MKTSSQFKRLLLAFLFLPAFLTSPITLAEEGEAETNEKTAYMQIKPTLITNYQGPHLKYVRTDIAIRVGEGTRGDIAVHRDAVKDILIMLLSRQDKETLTSQDGLESVKEEAKEEIIALLEAENAKSDVVEVLFMSFLVE